MASSKLLNTWDVLAAVESVYGTNPTLSGSDGVLVIERPEPSTSYLHDGERGMGSGRRLRRVAPSGLGQEITLMAEAYGLDSGTFYDGSSVFPFLHTLLLGCGLEGTFTDPDVTPDTGDEIQEYAPETGPSGFDSLSIEAYSRGQKYEINGAYGTFTISVDGPAVPVWEFTYQGIGNVPVDDTPPSITSYPDGANLPTKAVNMALTINPDGAGDITNLKLRGFNFDLGRDLSDRANDNASNAHAGFSPALPAPTLELTVEAEDLSGSPAPDPYSWWDTGAELDVHFVLGSDNETYWGLRAAHAYVTNVEDADDGPSAIWVISLDLRAADASSLDYFNIKFGEVWS